jgi:hypothetical protein
MANVFWDIGKCKEPYPCHKNNMKDGDGICQKVEIQSIHQIEVVKCQS